MAEFHFEGQRRIRVVAVEGSGGAITLLLSQEEVSSMQAKSVYAFAEAQHKLLCAAGTGASDSGATL